MVLFHSPVVSHTLGLHKGGL
ncbi:hypothetical protein Ahy_A05g022072 isoform C [Arachis hypogaea]|uniref:Uncharacterized protein n=1 Tax=Arachis hypogaea TaxID=3818 RepID=A0A445CZJ7_ARAHY|nr:hypothetical protein Ahy_A05g022072 isoform C [Arachis hypogaea]